MTADIADGGTRTLVVDGQLLRIAARPGTGAGGAPPLLMLNGIGAGLEVLDPLTRALDPGRALLRVDVPGAGGSPPGVLPYGFPQLAMLLRRLLDRLGHDRVDLLGYSWGGGLAQQFALQYPRSCRRLILVSTSTGAVSVPGSPFGLLSMLTPRRYGSPRDVAAMAGIVDGLDARATGGTGGEARSGGRRGSRETVATVATVRPPARQDGMRPGCRRARRRRISWATCTSSPRCRRGRACRSCR